MQTRWVHALAVHKCTGLLHARIKRCQTVKLVKCELSLAHQQLPKNRVTCICTALNELEHATGLDGIAWHGHMQV